MEIKELLAEIMKHADDMSRPVKLYNKERNIHIDISGIEYVKNLKQIDIEFECEP